MEGVAIDIRVAMTEQQQGGVATHNGRGSNRHQSSNDRATAGRGIATHNGGGSNRHQGSNDRATAGRGSNTQWRG